MEVGAGRKSLGREESGDRAEADRCHVRTPQPALVAVKGPELRLPGGKAGDRFSLESSKNCPALPTLRF